MSFIKINGVNFFYELKGRGQNPLVFVHGSWSDHHAWDMVSELLSDDFRILSYDRRGHSMSERPEMQGSINEDSDDLASIIKELGLSPAHIAGNSFGASISLRTALRHPEVIRTISVNEPPLFDLLEGNENMKKTLLEIRSRLDKVAGILERGDMESGARIFFETIAGSAGDWERLPEEIQKRYIFNAPTWLDETKDPESLRLDINELAKFQKPALVTRGGTSPPFFHVIVELISDVLPNVERHIYPNAGHSPHASHPEEYAKQVKEFISEASK
ncbi:MAG TPA: alpha/beta hydrolase [Ignavibacteria bacterium]|jgi:pimeloyl-ACP methyl ester carboxylesterase